VAGGLVLALLACVGPGDEVIIPDPYFLQYKHLVRLVGATPVYVDTYPDFQTTAARIEPHITPRTKMILFNTPGNPTGVVATDAVCRELVALADRHNLLLLSDEIYDEFCHEKIPRPSLGGTLKCPSPASHSDRILLLRGFSKTYAMTGWRLGFAVGPAPIIEQMTKIQQHSFVCAPSMVQAAGVTALDLDMSPYVEAYRKKRDTLVAGLRGHYELTTPGGAFYAFPKVPAHLGLTGQQFVERAIERNLLVIPGNVFSERDTHFRISYACADDMLAKGIALLVDLAKG
jgi:aspartate/methionine/tyrosine aminotransferase